MCVCVCVCRCVLVYIIPKQFASSVHHFALFSVWRLISFL